MLLRYEQMGMREVVRPLGLEVVGPSGLEVIGPSGLEVVGYGYGP
jgi:hypothetical protein